MPALAGAQVVKEEVTVGKSRFDFLLRQKARDIFLEVKSCTLFGNEIAMFPDAVTARGMKHLEELADMGRKGILTAVLFLVHYPHVKWFMPDYHTDLQFSQTMLKARRFVRMMAVAVKWNSDLTLGGRAKTLPIPWDYLVEEVKDQGAYLLILECKKERNLTVGKLGGHTFTAGYYVYVGSAMKGLSARIDRHKRKRKTFRWHVDYLAAVADRVIALPIRSSQRMECPMARRLSATMPSGPEGFGSSDCRCASHLFWSPTNPLHEQTFHDMLQGFRMRTP